MKKSLLVTLLTVASSAMALAADAAQDCTPVGAQVTQEVTAKPENILAIVSEQIAANPSCACEVVKAAIQAAKADKETVGQIVFTAVIAAPTEATSVAECAVAVAPEASENIKAALRSAVSDKNPVSYGKNSGKDAPLPPADDTPDFGLSPVAIGGVYLVYPSVGGGLTSGLVKKNGKWYFIGRDGKLTELTDDQLRDLGVLGSETIVLDDATDAAGQKRVRDLAKKLENDGYKVRIR